VTLTYGRLVRASSRAAAVLVLAVVCGAATACSPPPDHPELAVQQTEGGSFVVHFADCSDPQVDEVRVIEDWGELQQDLVTFGPDELAAPDPGLGATALGIIQRNAWPPRLRFEVDGDEPFEVTFDPDDVPPVPTQLLVPDAPNGEEIVELEDFEARCD
jgi:hypothetical protein